MDNQRPVYFGRPENQRDPNAILPGNQQQLRLRRQNVAAKPAEALAQQQLQQPPQPQQPQQQQQPAKAARGRRFPRAINPPARLQTQADLKDVIPDNEGPAKSAIFATGMSSREINLDTRFTPSAIERDVLLMLDQSAFSIPEPIMVQIKVIGNTQTMTKEHLHPEFPELPTQQIAGFGGYYGRINEDTHNLYEEIPCMGVLSEAVRHSISNEPPGPYASSLAEENLTPTSNLLGFQNLGSRRNKAKNLAFHAGITNNEFPSYPPNTGINLNLLQAISAQLSHTKTFRVQTIAFGNLSESGLLAIFEEWFRL
ncbi:uncharacterized protein LOC118645133 isoform X2 [Monomorium pharaonis]|uniref:uncharacterized protein LOC118645133 isoform X1 n=1 Tax=Monomorium pharaonis TaxID=307658 RepID=UPI001747D008|nr:uncharacterized protein LOC118645133 isoform X1 [Monomorium pharaonis]XP_036141520.1 uncharacterized protein LOC118645133 isoform X2 [Monomorium pharaonis]